MPINQSYPKPIHLNEIKNLKFNKDAFNQINLQLDQQDKLITSLTIEKTYEFIYAKKYLVLLILAILIYCIFKYFKNNKKKVDKWMSLCCSVGYNLQFSWSPYNGWYLI